MAKPKIIVVDNDQNSLKILETSLNKAGFVVTTSTDGADALEKVKTFYPDLVISDVTLPKIDGYEFCKKLKEDPKTASIPFIFLTRQKSVDDKIRGLELGVDDYLTKPIYIKEVITRVKILLEKKEKERLELPSTGIKFTGNLADMGAVDLIQTLELGNKSGEVHFVNGKNRGSIYLKKGKIIDAEQANLRGQSAVYRLLNWTEGTFKIDFKEIEREDKIGSSNQSLIMEGMRRIDELGKIQEELPPLDSTLIIDSQMILKDHPQQFPAKVEDILAEFDGKTSIQEVLDKTSYDDLEVLKTISKLYFQGYLMEHFAPSPEEEIPISPEEEIPIPLEEEATPSPEEDVPISLAEEATPSSSLAEEIEFPKQELMEEKGSTVPSALDPELYLMPPPREEEKKEETARSPTPAETIQKEPEQQPPATAAEPETIVKSRDDFWAGDRFISFVEKSSPFSPPPKQEESAKSLFPRVEQPPTPETSVISMSSVEPEAFFNRKRLILTVSTALLILIAIPSIFFLSRLITSDLNLKNIFSFSAPAKIDPVAEKYYQEAETHILLHTPPEYQEAAKNLARALEVSPDYFLAQAALSQSYSRWGALIQDQGMLQRALELAKKGQKKRKNLPALRIALAEAKANLGENEEAKKIITQLLKEKPEAGEAYYVLGSIYQRNPQTTDLGIENLRKSVILKPKLTIAHLALGMNLLKMDKLSDCLLHLKRAAELSPENSLVHSSLGLAFSKSREFSQAKEAYQEALRIDPENIQARINLSEIYYQQYREYEQARKNLTIALSKCQPGSNQMKEANYHLGRVYSELKQKSNAKSHFQEVVKLDPYFLDTRERLESLTQAPEPPKPAPRKKPKTVAKAPKKKVESTKKNENLRMARHHHNLGKSFYAKGNLESAASEYQQALKFNPRADDVYADLGNVFFDLGRDNNAITALRNSIRINPNNAEAHLGLGSIYSAQGKKADAIVHYLKFLNLKPNSEFSQEVRTIVENLRK
jgi:tetratricopeptide (TPR) repeat protein/CheY-like chemotaxis protein